MATLDRLLTLQVKNCEGFQPPYAKHWAERLLPGKNIQASRLHQSELTLELLWASVFPSANWGRYPHIKGVKRPGKAHPDQVPPATPPFLLQKEVADPEFSLLLFQVSDVAGPSIPHCASCET